MASITIYGLIGSQVAALYADYSQSDKLGDIMDRIDSNKIGAITVFCDESLGIYIPKDFAETVDTKKLRCVESYDLEVLLEGPENEMYWDSWDTVLREAFFLDENGDVYELYQDGSLFVICIDRMTDQEYLDFFGEPRE